MAVPAIYLARKAMPESFSMRCVPPCWHSCRFKNACHARRGWAKPNHHGHFQHLVTLEILVALFCTTAEDNGSIREMLDVNQILSNKMIEGALHRVGRFLDSLTRQPPTQNALTAVSGIRVGTQITTNFIRNLMNSGIVVRHGRLKISRGSHLNADKASGVPNAQRCKQRDFLHSKAHGGCSATHLHTNACRAPHACGLLALRLNLTQRGLTLTQWTATNVRGQRRWTSNC